MPTYEYKCQACGHHYDLFQSIKAAPVKKCPKCGKLRAKRLIGSGAGLIFKGTGFYITDYRDGSGPPKSETEKAAETKTSDTKTAEPAKAESGKNDSAKAEPAKPVKESSTSSKEKKAKREDVKT